MTRRPTAISAARSSSACARGRRTACKGSLHMHYTIEGRGNGGTAPSYRPAFPPSNSAAGGRKVPVFSLAWLQLRLGLHCAIRVRVRRRVQDRAVRASAAHISFYTSCTQNTTGHRREPALQMARDNNQLILRVQQHECVDKEQHIGHQVTKK